MASNPTNLRHHRPRAHLAFCALGLLAALGSPVCALEDPYPAQITPPASMVVLPSTLVVDDSAPVTAHADYIMKSHGNHELRLKHRHRHMHMHRRQKEDEDSDTKSDDDGKKDSKTKTATADEEDDDDDDEKTATEDEKKTTATGDEKKTKTISDDDSAPTKTISEDLDDISSFTLSVAPTTTSTESPATDSPLPEPFDGTVSSEFKTSDGDDSCPNFITALLNSPTFQDCYPLSMMMQTSTGFFNARKQLTSTVRVLDATCAADVDSCNNFMSTAAKNLTSSDNCKDEYDDGLTTVMQAYRGLVSYETIYTVTCLQDPDTDSYCFANAVTNLSTPSDAYLYFLPYDLELPGSSSPTCNWCNKETMAFYHAASADRDQPVANTYESAARQINTLCGPDFVNSTLPEASEDAGVTVVPSWAAMIGTAFLVAGLSSIL